jgi:hypothetical protein
VASQFRVADGQEKKTFVLTVLLLDIMRTSKNAALTTKRLFVSLNSDIRKTLFMASGCARNSA